MASAQYSLPNTHCPILTAQGAVSRLFERVNPFTNAIQNTKLRPSNKKMRGIVEVGTALKRQ